MTQPAATKLIQELEDMLGVSLFQRDRRGMKLTAHGAIVRRHVDVLLANVDDLREELKAFDEGASGRIRLGIIPSLSPSLLAGAVATTLVAQPGTRFEMQEGATDALLSALARNDLDIVFGRVLDAQRAEALNIVPIYTESFAIACSVRHPLSHRPRVGWHQLSRASWALPASGTPLRELADNLFTTHGVLRPRVAVASSSFHQLRHLIGSSELLGFLPRSIAEPARANGELALLKPTLGADFSPISLLSRADAEASPAVVAFARTVRQTALAMGLT